MFVTLVCHSCLQRHTTRYSTGTTNRIDRTVKVGQGGNKINKTLRYCRESVVYSLLSADPTPRSYPSLDPDRSPDRSGPRVGPCAWCRDSGSRFESGAESRSGSRYSLGGSTFPTEKAVSNIFWAVAELFVFGYHAALPN